MKNILGKERRNIKTNNSCNFFKFPISVGIAPVSWLSIKRLLNKELLLKIKVKN